MVERRSFTFPDGEIVEVEVTLNVEEIALEMAMRCKESKAGKAQQLHGAIKAKIVNRTNLKWSTAHG